MTDEKAQLTFQQLTVIELLKSHTQAQHDAIKGLEHKAQQNFIIINIIAAIIVGFNFGLVGDIDINQVFQNQPALILVAALYALIALLSLRTLHVSDQGSYPMSPTWLNARDWSSCALETHIEILVRSYLRIYRHNATIVDSKGILVRLAHRMIGLVIVLLALETTGLSAQFLKWAATLFY